MATLKDLARRLMTLVSRRRFERDLADEMQLHVDLRTARETERGASSTEAARVARRAFGNTLRFREESRDAWGWRKLDEIGRALRDAARGLVRSKLEWSFIAMVLAVGIGTMSGAWTVLQAVLLTPPPYPAVDRLVVMSRQSTDGGSFLSGDDVEDIRAGAGNLETLAAYAPELRAVAEINNPRARRELGIATSPELLRVLGVAVKSGRDFRAEDVIPGARPTVILSAAMARDTGSGVGAVIDVDGVPTEVIGITPEDFGFPEPGVHFYLPAATRRTWRIGETGAGGMSYLVIARLRAGASIETASAQIDGIIGSRRERVAMQSYQDDLIAPVKGTLVSIQIGAGLVLLLTTINVAWLLYARARRRLSVYTLMTALGAAPIRLLISYFAEVLVLGLIAVPAAGLMAAGLVAGLLRLDNGTVSRWHPSVQLSAMGVALALAIVVAILASLAGALAVARASNARHVFAHSKANGLPRRRRYVLMTMQTAVVVMICGQAARLTTGVVNLMHSNVGFHHSDLMTASLSNASASDLPPEARVARSLRIYEDVTRAGLDAALTTTLPLGNETAAFGTQSFSAARTRGSSLMADVHAVTPSYFRLANIAFLEGGPIRDDDDAVVINRTLSSAIFGGDSAVGKRISLCHGGAVVKGVVDTKPTRLFGETKPEIYLAYGALPHLPLCNYRMFMGQLYILSDLNQGAGRARTTIANAAHADWPDAVVEFKPFREYIWKALGVLALLSAGISSLGLVAVLLMAGGTSGMLREDLYRSSREIAIKVALGASPRQILAQIGRPLAIVACIGLLLGAAGAWEAERLMRALSPHLVEGQAEMGVGFGGAALVLMAVGLATCWVPMSRAAHADPIVSLRSAEE